jgi:hypothetical protein
MRRLYLLAIAVLLAVVAITAVGYRWYSINFKHPGYTPQAFSSDTWQTAGPDIRGYMVNDMLKRHPLRGRTLDEVTALLGNPDHQFGGKPGFPGLITYRLGYMGMNPKALMVLSYTLNVRFDDAGKVEHAVVDD